MVRCSGCSPERWIWQSLGGQPEVPCIEQYVTCLREIGRPLQREWKTRIYSSLAERARPEMPLHAAARAAELPTDSDHFRQLLELIPTDDEELA